MNGEDGNEQAILRRRLDRVIVSTAGAEDLPGGGWWVGDVAGERQTRDDMAAGRLSWRNAHRCAREGLAALDEGNLEKARTYAWIAYDHFIAAIMTRLRPSDWDVLHKPAARRGRRPK